MSTLGTHVYDPFSGKFFTKEGHQFGSYKGKYARSFIDGKQVRLHRYAFYLMEGKWPTEEIDHINGNTLDNRWVNLRKCSSGDNRKNKGKYSNNTSGYKGVSVTRYKDKIYYGAFIQNEGEFKYLGRYKTAEDAYEAYKKAAKDLFGNFSRELEN